MKIISHSCGAGLGLENTASAIKASLQYDIDAIEIDVRYTRDGHPVLVHDHTTQRIADKNLVVKNATLKELRQLTLKNGEKILTLQEAIELIGNKVPIYLDMKDTATVRSLLKILDKYPDSTFVMTGRIHEFIKTVSDERGHTSFLVQSHFGPFEVIQTAKKLGAVGITMNAWILNPLSYRLAKRYNLRLCIYTVDSRFVMWFIRRFYNDIWVSTNVPHHFVSKRKNK